ncbi:3-deoxy-7-phosphoheptulonate synthase class II [Streptomyces griseocarneus]|nr:3-deoxy-7-phosphoheptulonate synthase class II [Streptomyces griseocarneus]
MTAVDLIPPSDPFPRRHPEWPDLVALPGPGGEQRSRPPLVFAAECGQLRARLASVARGEAFLLQAPVCAENLATGFADAIDTGLRALLQMSAVLTYAMAVPVVRVGRIGGPDPGLREYRCEAAALNLVRGLLRGGYADLAQVQEWNRSHVTDDPGGHRHAPVVTEMDGALRFMMACGVNTRALWGAEFFTGHAMSVPDYERALRRADGPAAAEGLHDVSAHMVWAERPDAAAVALAARLRNPIGVRVGPGTTPDDVLTLVEHLDPAREPGRLTFIVGTGADRVRDVLPDLVGKAAATGALPAWVCDPLLFCDGRTDAAYEEAKAFFEVHRELGTHPGGLHLDGSAFSRGRLLDLAFSVAELY